MIPDSQQAQICTDGFSLVLQKVFLNVERCTLALSVPDDVELRTCCRVGGFFSGQQADHSYHHWIVRALAYGPW